MISQVPFPETALCITRQKGNLSGILGGAHSIANFFILNRENKEIESKVLNQLVRGINRNQVVPICWFKLELGLEGLESLPNWEENLLRTEIQEIEAKYSRYLQTNFQSMKGIKLNDEEFLSEDLGEITEQERQKHAQDCLDVLKQFENM